MVIAWPLEGRFVTDSCTRLHMHALVYVSTRALL